MWPYHPVETGKYPPLPLIEGNKIIEYNPDQTQSTTWYTERAVKFIDKNKEQPFFLYLAHTMPHVPLHVSDKFKGKSKRGLYGDHGGCALPLREACFSGNKTRPRWPWHNLSHLPQYRWWAMPEHAGGHKLVPAKAGSVKLQGFVYKTLVKSPTFLDENQKY